MVKLAMLSLLFCYRINLEHLSKHIRALRICKLDICKISGLLFCSATFRSVLDVARLLGVDVRYQTLRRAAEQQRPTYNLG